MSGPSESVKRWSGYVCPDCRSVFRVPRDHEGLGIVCPSCNRMLRLPQAGEESPPLVSGTVPAVVAELPREMEEEALAGYATAEEGTAAPEGSVMKKRRKRRRPKGVAEDETPDWEQEPRVASSRKREQERRQLGRLVAGGGLLAALLAGGVLWALRGGGDAPAAPVGGERTGARDADDGFQLPEILRHGEDAFLAVAEPLARGFLEATRVEELLPLIRDPEQTEPLLRQWYPDGIIEPDGLASFNVSGTLTYRGPVAGIDVTTRDFRLRQLAFIETPDGLRIDWESWVGWSEMRWEEILSQRPTEPLKVRVNVRQVDYYNFDFADEDRWQSYRLDSPDGEHMLFGYAERGTLLNERLRPYETRQVSSLILRISFPEGSRPRSNQVLIHEVVDEGWVDGLDAQ